MSIISLKGIEISKIVVENISSVTMGAIVKRKPSPFVVIHVGDKRVGKTKSAARKKNVKFKEILFTKEAKVDDVLKLSVYHSTINFLFGSDQFLGCASVNLNEIVRDESKRFNLPLERAERGNISFTLKSYNFGIDSSDKPEETEGENENEKTEKSIVSNTEDTQDETPLTGDSTIFQSVDSDIFLGKSGDGAEFLSANSFRTHALNGGDDEEDEEEDDKQSKYEIIRQIGKGGMGEVFLANDKTSRNKEVVLKKIKCKTIKKVNDSMAEIWPTRKLEHPNICVIQDVFFTSSKQISESKDEKPHFLLNLVMKYYRQGDLNAYLKKTRKSNKKLDSEIIHSYMIQLADALEYIHSNNVLHRDIKPENIFLDEDYKRVLIGDFGLARKFSTKSLASTSCGTPLYMAPEVMSSRRYNDRADIWSLGCVFYKLCTLKLKRVFNMEVYSNPEFHKQIHQLVVNELNYPNWFSELICRMLDKDGHKRPSSKQLHEVLLEEKNKNLEEKEEKEEEEDQEKETEKKEEEIIEDFSELNWLDLLRNNDWERLKKCLVFVKEIKGVDDLVSFEKEEISMTPLIYAQKNNQMDIMELLLEKGSADPNEADTDGFTPLIRGVMWEQVDCIKLLLSFGAEPRMRSREGLTTFNYIDRLEKKHLLELFD